MLVRLDETNHVAVDCNVLDAHVKAIQVDQKMRHDHQQHRASMAESVVGMVAGAQAHDQKMEHADAAHRAQLSQQKEPKE